MTTHRNRFLIGLALLLLLACQVPALATPTLPPLPSATETATASQSPVPTGTATGMPTATETATLTPTPLPPARRVLILSIDGLRPDAIALALKSNAPIFVEDRVIDNAKTVDFVPDKENSERLQKWLEGLDPDTMGRYKM